MHSTMNPLCNSRTTHQPSPKIQFPFFLYLVFYLYLPTLDDAKGISFKFPNFNQTQNIIITPDATVQGGEILLTRARSDTSSGNSVGRATYAEPIRLWESASKTLTNFTTHFSFIINAPNKNNAGDGLAFFLARNGSSVPPNSDGGSLGLVTSGSDSSENQIVAVEFDTYPNSGFDPTGYHVGIDVNSIKSKVTVLWNDIMINGTTAHAWVSYDGITHNLSVFLTYVQNPFFDGNSCLSYVVDLRDILPELVYVGFSGATGSSLEVHNILSWSFNSSLEIGESGEKKNKSGMIVGLVLCVIVLIGGLGLLWFILWKKRCRGKKEEGMGFDVSLDDEFEKGTGPKRFTYRELACATNNFAEEGKLGEGGFGGVYRGFLSDLKLDVAVKRVSKGSKQGKKEYVSEVKIISRLRHKNLVQLFGWCHEQGEFLLVYELMPNGSLDSHLFKGKSLLTWATRYRIAQGLASALLYLHEEWEQCVVHRDIKSSNLMLDSGFNAKLGDFGLARLVDHELGSQTTVLAGTMGYLAPECLIRGKATKESDVYSFGVVALEIVCGRRAVEHKAQESQVLLVEWVWELYGRGQHLEAVDQRLSRDYNEQETECLMIVALWCAHPDRDLRPSIRQAISVLNFEAPLPNLPSKMPVPMYFAPPMRASTFSTTSSGGSCTTSSSMLTVTSGTSSSLSLLYTE